MPSLSRELRRLLERTIAGTDGARQIAEDGADQSLKRLAVDRHEPHTSLSSDERKLRNELRAHGRQLGDKRDLQRGTQTIDHLKQAVAYEHWHRLLFARFLVENDLLMHPEHGVALSMDDVKELALGRGCDWIELAADYAQQMLLREVFRSDDPALRVPLPPEKRRGLEEKLNLLPRAVFLADDSLGWVYQFWQRDEKDRVNRSGVKIGADELPAVTQLFTEDYMVLFLLENTLGSWWAAKRGREGKDESLPGYAWTYLRLNKDGTPVVKASERWPSTSREIKILDPCMGSGHFLIFALPILARMRMEEEGLTLKESIRAVLESNLFGLELDPRCAQIAAFNLALVAWRIPGQYFALPELNLACSGIGPNASKDQWIKLGEEIAAKVGMPAAVNLFGSEDSLLSEPIRRTMESLHELFSQASVLGSLINPANLSVDLFQANYATVAPLLAAVLRAQDSTEETRERVVAAAGMVKAAALLANKFTLVVTNVPYLGRGKQNSVLADFCEKHHADSKADLSTTFVDRCLRFCEPGGSTALVTPQNWMFLTSYKKFRRRLLTSETWRLLVNLGPNAFKDMNWWAATTALSIITVGNPSMDETLMGLDTSGLKEPDSKSAFLAGSVSRTSLSEPHDGFSRAEAVGPLVLRQSDQLSNPDSRFIVGEPSELPLLSELATAFHGLTTGDSERMQFAFWELGRFTDEWMKFCSSCDETQTFGGRSFLLRWHGGSGPIDELIGARKDGQGAWGKRGVLIRQMRHLPATLYDGDAFDNNTAVIIPNQEQYLPALWSFVASRDYSESVRRVDQKVSVTSATLVKIPFDLEYWKGVAREQFPNGLPAAESDDLTQWIFHGHPAASNRPLHVAIARLLGFRWPSENGVEMQLSDRAQALVKRNGELAEIVKEDGILCIPSVNGQDTAADWLRQMLATAYGMDWSSAKLTELLGSNGSLEAWLRDRFFEEHCQLFFQRPFVWHVWDGRKDGFHALVNYHKLNRRNMEKLIFSYLGDWLTRQRQDLQNEVEGADTRLAAAEHLQEELRKILEGEEPYDIFIRWKALDKQPIGWEPDLNDGVRINIRPWITESKLYRASKPGILRVTPNINYTKDRGQEPARDPKKFPWFSKSANRINDHHLSLDEKRRARGL